MGHATEQEAKLVVEMAARYTEVKEELNAIEAAMENFDRQNAVEPPAHLKAKVLAKVSGSQFSVSGSGDGKSEAKVIELTPWSNRTLQYAAAILFLLFSGSVIYILLLREDLNSSEHTVAALDNKNDSLKAELTNQYYAIVNLSEDIALLKKPSMKSIELKGMEVAPDAKAMVYANTTSGEVYLELVNLPPAPEGMQYQFWGIVDGKPVDAGMIPIDGDLSGIHPMKTVLNTTAYAISLEPKGGSQQPTGKIYVMGNS